jgi:hypothetical protein
MDLRKTLANSGVQIYSDHSVLEKTGPRIDKRGYLRAATHPPERSRE